MSEVSLGLRDYRWVADRLPGKVAPMDGDFILERKGHVLFIEFKPPGATPNVGQARTFRTLRRWAEVWVVQGDGPMVDVDFGDGFVRLSVEELADEVALWYEEAGQ